MAGLAMKVMSSMFIDDHVGAGEESDISSGSVWGGQVLWLTRRGCSIGDEGYVKSEMLVMGFHI